jgi:hypothetical protein
MGIKTPYLEVLQALMGQCASKTKKVILTHCPSFIKKAKMVLRNYLCGTQNGDAYCAEIVAPFCTKNGTCSPVAPKMNPKTSRRRLQDEQPIFLQRIMDPENPQNSKYSMAFLPEACLPKSLGQDETKRVCAGGHFKGFTNLVDTIKSGLDSVAHLTKTFSKSTQISRKKLFLCNSWKRIKKAEKTAKITANNILKSSLDTGYIYIKIKRDFINATKKELVREYPNTSAAQKKIIDEKITPFLDLMKATAISQQRILPISWRLDNSQKKNLLQKKLGENWTKVYNKFSLGKNINAASDNHFFRIMQAKILLAIPKLEKKIKDVNLKVTT